MNRLYKVKYYNYELIYTCCNFENRAEYFSHDICDIAWEIPENGFISFRVNLIARAETKRIHKHV